MPSGSRTVDVGITHAQGRREQVRVQDILVCSLDGVRPSAASSPTASPVRTMLATPEPAQLENVPIAVPLHDDAVGSVAVQVQEALQ